MVLEGRLRSINSRHMIQKGNATLLQCLSNDYFTADVDSLHKTSNVLFWGPTLVTWFITNFHMMMFPVGSMGKTLTHWQGGCLMIIEFSIALLNIIFWGNYNEYPQQLIPTTWFYWEIWKIISNIQVVKGTNFSVLNRKSHCCAFESSLGHMWDKPVLLVGGQVFFLGISRFRPTCRLTRVKMSEIILMGVKPKSKIKIY